MTISSGFIKFVIQKSDGVSDQQNEIESSIAPPKPGGSDYIFKYQRFIFASRIRPESRVAFFDFTTNKIMEKTQDKEKYMTPEVAVFEIKPEGLVCTSGMNNPSGYPGSPDPFGF